MPREFCRVQLRDAAEQRRKKKGSNEIGEASDGKERFVVADSQMLIQGTQQPLSDPSLFQSVSLMGRAGWQLGSSRLGGVLEG